MTRSVIPALCASLLLGSASALAQTPPPASTPPQPPPPMSFAAFLKAQNNGIKGNLLKSAEKMPEEHYAFQPTKEVRTFGQLLGHVANAQYSFCAPVKGEANPMQGKDAEKLTTKADLVKALTDAMAYCDAAYAGLTDTNVVEMIKVTGRNNVTRELARANQLTFNLAHNNEHYGNIVTYMRIKGLVPPSSEPPAK